jgi:hypothetical protein
VQTTETHNVLARRQRPAACEFVEQLDDIGIARHFPDGFIEGFRHQGSWPVAREFLKFLVEFGIDEHFPHRFLENLDPFFGRRRRQEKTLAGDPEGPEHLQQSFFPRRFGKTLELGQVRKARGIGNGTLLTSWTNALSKSSKPPRSRSPPGGRSRRR